jgi:PIN domain nuclease of toxin-antitoxin system
MTSDLLILDTHIWIWAINGNVDSLSTEGLKAI